METRTAPPSSPALPAGGSFFGHPRGLSTLFFTEMWERFSYYGMRALLILYMTAAVAGANPGLGWQEGQAGAVYGLYTSLVYLLALPGGWVADRLWGQRKAVFVGGCIIALGHFTLAGPLVGLPEIPSFFLGLLFIVVGTGLLKPNVSTIVGDLYPRPGTDAPTDQLKAWSARRDAAFSIFYMGINVGAMLGPFICGTLGERVNWHWGFSAAGFGMVLGLIQYRAGIGHLGDAGAPPTDEPGALAARERRFYLIAGGIAAATALFALLASTRGIGLTLEAFATWLGYGILLLTILFFAALIFDVKWAAGLSALFLVLSLLLAPAMGATVAGQWAILVTLGAFMLASVGRLAAGGERVSDDQKRLMVIFWLFLLAAVFWSGFEQAGSSMNLFARDLTDRTIGAFEVPTTWLQNVNPFFIVILAPVFGWMWTWLATSHANPSTPVKFALGLLGLAGGFVVLAWGAANATTADGGLSVAWLVVTYFLHTCGELALSPVGLSSMTKLAPAGRVGQMMGVWFIAAALGNLFAGLVAGRLEVLPPDRLFWSVALFTGGVGAVALLVSPGVKRLMGRAE